VRVFDVDPGDLCLCGVFVVYVAGDLMRYWFDTEFMDDSRTIDLISIGMVAEDGRELYLENSEADFGKMNEFVEQHVLPFLEGPEVSRAYIAEAVKDFCDPEKYGTPEFWAYYADYDWVVLCQLFGRMIDLPKGWPMYCRDIKQEADRKEANFRLDLKDPTYRLDLPKDPEQEHHALADARWNKEAWEYLQSFIAVWNDGYVED
jgi:hypothetical protein